MGFPMSEVTIKNLHSGKVMTTAGAGEETKLGQCSSKGTDDRTERWRLVPVPGIRHQYQIQNVATDMVLEVAGESCEDRAVVSLWEGNGGPHQWWRLVPVGEGEHEYAIINAHSGKALDLWDGMWDDDARFIQVGYWHGMQQRWVLTSCDVSAVSRAVVTIVRDESVFLPIWLRYYGRFFSARDMYVLDHQSVDGSTEGHGFVRVPVSHPEYGASWQRDVQQCYQHELVGRYDVVLCTDVDEIVAPDPRLGDLGTYIDRFNDDFITCQGYEILHQKDHEPPFDPAKPVLGQRFTWYANPAYSKSLLARVPMFWHGGCHERVDGRTNNDPHLYLLHLHRMDYDLCLARHENRTRFPLAQVDQDQGWGYQNRITDLAEFSAWFYHDSGGPLPLHPLSIPPWWRDLA
ncbi:MAG: RICIN domain-containing protein [Pseudonocardiaceae bacterium]